MDRHHGAEGLSAMVVGSIDIGTNTILLLVAEAADGAVTRVLHDEQQIARLGRGVDAHRRLRHETMERAAAYLRTYKATAESLGAQRIVAVGTSAMRDAANADEFRVYIKETVGIEIEIISGEEEARWTFRGGIQEFRDQASRFSVLDIGGGSTEVIVGTNESIIIKRSFDVGCVRLTERFLRSSPPAADEIAQARSLIREMLGPIRSFGVDSTLGIAVAGTPTTLAALYQKLPKYDRERVTGFMLDRMIIEELFERLKLMSVEQIAALPQVSDGRADVLLAGVLILKEYLDLTGLDGVLVSDRGLRYGIIERESA